MARLRNTSNAPAPTERNAATKPRPALKEKTNTTRSKAAVYDNDGDTEGMVKDGQARRGRPRKTAHKEHVLRMTGALGQAEDRLTTTDKLVRSDGSMTAMTRQPVVAEAQNEAIGGVQKRTKAMGLRKEARPTKRSSSRSAPSSDALSRAPVVARQSVLAPAQQAKHDLLNSPPLPHEEIDEDEQRATIPPPSSVLRPQATPMVDTSVLRHFKRRPRQPSMLTMVQQRTASAAPSPTKGELNREASDFDVEDSVDDDQFTPDAEGTPLRMPVTGRSGPEAMAHSPRASNVDTTSLSRKRRSAELRDLSSFTDSIRVKRHRIQPSPSTGEVADLPEFTKAVLGHSRVKSQRKSLRAACDIQVINSSHPTPSPAEPGLLVGENNSEDDDVAIPSTEPREAGITDASTCQLPDDPSNNDLDDIMADPASSSSLSGMSPRSSQDPGILADPIRQMSLAPTQKKAGRQRKDKPLTTATLQSLLPKRRQPQKPRRRKSDYNLEVGSENDQVESNSEDGAVSSPTHAKRMSKVVPARGRQKSSATSRPNKGATESRKSAVASKHQHGKTYGKAKATASDKENDDAFDDVEEGDDTTDLPEVSMHEVAQSAELEAAKRKFAEIDQWDMVFEEQSDEDHRSSSQQWR